MKSLGIILGALLLHAALLTAGKPVAPINSGSKGLAVKGYDVVAYFTDGQPVKGSEQFAHTWGGVKWLFASAEHRDLFVKDPEKYAPQYGGYCAYAVSRGHTAGASPQKWRIVNGKLYLNHRFAAGKFGKDVEGNIKLADENWPKIPKTSAPQPSRD